jgi:hypothetical protein
VKTLQFRLTATRRRIGRGRVVTGAKISRAKILQSIDEFSQRRSGPAAPPFLSYPFFGFLSAIALFVFCPDAHAQSPIDAVPPAAWQIAGIRAAFGDGRVPISDSSAAVQRAALELCAERGWGACLEPQEIAVYLQSASRSLQLPALAALGQSGLPAARFSVEIADLLNPDAAMASSGKLRRSALHTLGQIGPVSAPVGEKIVLCLDDPDPLTRKAALQTLGALTRAGSPFEKEIAVRLDDPDPGVVLEALVQLGKIGRRADRSAKEIGKLLHQATHGELGARRIPYTPELRVRVERLCVKEENRFIATLKRARPEIGDRFWTEFDEGLWEPIWKLTIFQGLRNFVRFKL